MDSLKDFYHPAGDRSVIEQEIIDGKCYWDQIAPNWFRLIELPHDGKPFSDCVVIGNYRGDRMWRSMEWTATRLDGETKWFWGDDTAKHAKGWIEEFAKEVLNGR